MLDEYKKLPVWCWAKSERDKKPRQLDGTLADVTKPWTWTTYDQLKKAGKKHIGIVLNPDLQLTIVDFDNKEKNPASKELLAYFEKTIASAKTYTERSISGRGYHLYFRGQLPQNVKGKHIEAYSRERFMLVTHDVVYKAPIKKRDTIVTRIINKVIAKRNKINAITSISQPKKYTDKKVLMQCSASTVGTKFDQLYHIGDWSGYKSRSEADMALVTYLAMHTKNNEQVLSLFLQSKLADREKVHTRIQKYVVPMVHQARNMMPLQPPQWLIDYDWDAENKTNKKEKIKNEKKQKKIKTETTPKRETRNTQNRTSRKNKNSASNRKNKPQHERRSPKRDIGKYLKRDSEGHCADAEKTSTTNTQSAKRSESTDWEIIPAETFDEAFKIECGFDPPPNGLILEWARYFYKTMPRQLATGAIIAALSLHAGICGNSHNISGTGLNLYNVLLGATGSGKEGGVSAIDILLEHAAKTCQGINKIIGPSTISSGQALLKHLATQRCFVMVLGEIGVVLKTMVDAKAPAHELTKKKALLELYSKSGALMSIKPFVYADTDKNIGIIKSPAVSIFGEGTQQTFYQAIGEEQIGEGLASRFIVFDYTRGRPARNENMWCLPSKKLVTATQHFYLRCAEMQTQNKVTHCSITTKALKVLNEFDKGCDRRINKGVSVEQQLWNRAHLNALKIAANLAVSLDAHAPQIKRKQAVWAVELIKWSVHGVLRSFKSGEHDSEGLARQELDVRRAIEAYMQMSVEQKLSYKVPRKLAKEKKSQWIPYTYLRRRVLRNMSFKNAKMGAQKALFEILNEMVASTLLIKMDPEEAYEEYQLTAAIYKRGPNW